MDIWCFIMNRLALKFFAVSISCYTAIATAEFSQLPDFYSEPGQSSDRAYQSDGSESIDPFGGGLQLHYVDLVAPSNQMDIVINRAYSSSDAQTYKHIKTQGISAAKDNIVTYFGWTMHFGRLVLPSTGNIGGTGACGAKSLVDINDNIRMDMPDGSSRVFYEGTGTYSGMLISSDRWRGKCTGVNKLEITSPDGTTYLMDQLELHSNSRQFYPSKITNALGQSMSIEYGKIGNPTGITNNSLYIKQVTSGDAVVKYHYDSLTTTNMRLTQICHSTRCVKYSGESISSVPGFRFQLRTVIRPDGHKYQYKYYLLGSNTTSGNLSLQSVTTPMFKKTEYLYELKDFDVNALAGFNKIQTDVVQRKTVTGPGIQKKVWSYRYEPSSNGDTTIVAGPKNTVTYKHYGIQEASNGNMWRLGLLKSKSISSQISSPGFVSGTFEGSAKSETEEFEWGNQLLSLEDNFRTVRNGLNQTKKDNECYATFIKKKTITRDGTKYTTTFSNHDAHGNPRTVVETGNATKKTTYTYDVDTTKWMLNRVATETIEGVGTIAKTYFPNGALKTNTEYGVKTAYEYDGSGHLSKKTNANEHSVSYSNYKNGIAQLETHPENVVIRRVVNGFGNIDNETNGNNITTSYGYDAINRVTSISQAGLTPVSILYSHSSGGSTKTTTRGSYQKTESFDAEGNATSTTVTGAGNITTTATFDALNRKTFESYPNSSNGTSYSYDELDRIKTTTQPGGSVSYTYLANNQVSVTNERNIPTTYTYRSFGNPDEKSLIRIDSPEGITTTIDRNAIGLINFIDQNGVRRTNEYNNSKNKLFRTGLVQPEIGTTTFGHDNMGNVTSKTVAGKTTSYGYDLLERQETINYPGDTPDVTFTYDGNSNIKTIDNGVTFIEFNYFNHDGIKDKTLTIDGLEFKSSYTYNNVDLLDSITYPSGEVVDLAADVFGRPSKVGAYVTSVDFHPTGLPKTLSYANGQTVEYQLNNRNWIETLDATGSAFNSMVTYGYDALGNVETIEDSIDAEFNRVLTYDDVNRLENATGSWGTGTFKYNTRGDVLSKTLQGNELTYNYDGNTQKLTSVSGTRRNQSYEYDGYGNIKNNGRYQFVFDDAQNMVSAIGAQTISNVYDGNNIRAKEDRNGEVIYFYYGKAADLMGEYNAQGEMVKEYIYLSSQKVAEITGPGYVDENANEAPIAEAGENQTVLAGNTVQLDGTSSTDQDGSITGYTWTQLEGTNLVINNAQTGTPTFVAPEVTEEHLYELELIVTDDKGKTANDSVFITVQPKPIVENELPTAVAGDDQTVNAGVTVIMDGKDSFDNDGNIMQYQWVQLSGTSVSLQKLGSVASFTAPTVTEDTVLSFQLTVLDNNEAPATDVVNITIKATVTGENIPPVAAAGNNVIVKPEVSVTLTGGNSTDPDGSIVSYHWVQTTGPAQDFDANAQSISFTTEPQRRWSIITYIFELTVTDDKGAIHTDSVSVFGVQF
jgi:YD repeat-containing protein